MIHQQARQVQYILVVERIGGSVDVATLDCRNCCEEIDMVVEVAGAYYGDDDV
jgi:hypothetical protein